MLPHLSIQVVRQLLSDAAAASEERAARASLQQYLVDDAAVAVDEVGVLPRHAHMVQQPQELLRHDGHPAQPVACGRASRACLFNSLLQHTAVASLPYLWSTCTSGLLPMKRAPMS